MLGQLAALLWPDRGVAPLVRAGRYKLSMAIVIGAALLAAAAAAARVDMAPSVHAENAGAPPPSASGGKETAGDPANEPKELKTDTEIEEEIRRQTGVVQVKLALGAALGTPAKILLLAIGLLLLGRYVGAKPRWSGALSIASVAALPWAVRSLVAAAAALRQPAILPQDLGGLVASGLPIAHPLLAGVDLFSLWSLVLCGFGLADATGTGRLRSFLAVSVGFVLILLVSMAGAR